MRQRARSRFTLGIVELCLIFSLLGSLLAIAIPTFVRHVRTSKIREASQRLAQLYRLTRSYYSRAHWTGIRSQTHCIIASLGPLPAMPSVEPLPDPFVALPQAQKKMWFDLGFRPRNIRYRYSVHTSGPSQCAGGHTSPINMVLRAEGDLDGDGAYSLFERSIWIRPDGTWHPDPVLHIKDRTE
jgi:type II secretory pathway pseudopilin PulG